MTQGPEATDERMEAELSLIDDLIGPSLNKPLRQAITKWQRVRDAAYLRLREPRDA